MTPAALLAYVIPLTLIGLTIADFIPDQKIDTFLIGALLIFGLGALGWRLDDILGKDAAEAVKKTLPISQKPDEPSDEKAGG
jgi:di/tricarboxylate transporter